MDISAISSSTLQQISSTATRPGDAVAVSVMRKALDIQSAQATQLIDSIAKSVPDPSSRLGQNIDIKV